MGTVKKQNKKTKLKTQPFTPLQRESREKHLSKLAQCTQYEERNRIKSLLIAGLVLGLLRYLQMKEILILKF